MDVFVGTSGWSYGWNRGGDPDWYAGNSFMNAVEPNAGFYRFPFRNQVSGWSKKGRELRWCIRVHRSITRQFRFNGTARETGQWFRDLFSPPDPLSDRYLFPAPPSMKNGGRPISFTDGLPGPEKCVPGIRNRDLLPDDTACRKPGKYVPPVSAGSPDARNRIFAGCPVSARMHGRDDRYRHDYTQEELEGTAAMQQGTGAGKAYLFFTSNNSMPENAQPMRALFTGTGDPAHGHAV